MRVLLDTCVLSELRRPECDVKVQQAIDANDNSNLFISVITIGEIIKGISLLDEGRRKRDLQDWIFNLELHYGDRILPIDLETTRIWGELTAMAKRNGRVLASADGLIAATAFRHGLHIMTRNVADFEITKAMIFNPWE